MMEAGGLSGRGSSPPGRYRFEDVVVDTSAHTLLRGGAPCQLEPKAFAVLVTLLQRAGELVGHDELLDTVWGHRHVTAGVLTRAIAQLRAVLGDDAHQPRYIQTQHALGYRFIAEATFEPVVRRMDVSLAGQGVPVAEPARSAGPAAAIPERTVMQTGQQPWDARHGRRRRLAWAAAPVLVVALALLVLAWLRPDARKVSAAEASVAVMPFSSLSDMPADALFAEGLAVEMNDALAGVPGLKVAAMQSAGPDRGDVRELGRLLGVATVLDASVRRHGDRIRINARLTDAGSGFILWSDNYDREASDIFGLQAEIANEVVMALLGVLPQEAPRLARRLRPTSDIDAYEPYLKGLRILQGTAPREQLVVAIDHFRQALEHDPRFGRAQAGICRAQVRLFELNRDADALAPAQAACALAARLDASLREVSLAKGDLHRARHDFDAAREEYTRALEDIELRPAAYIGLGQVASAEGDDALAMDYFERTRAVRPGDARVHKEIGYQHYRQGRYPQATESYRVATTLAPDDASLWSSLGGLYLVAGDRKTARRAFEQSLVIEPVYGALSNLGYLSWEDGDYAGAAEYYRRAAKANDSDFRVFGNIADALSMLPDGEAQAREAYRRATERAQRWVVLNGSDAEALASLAWYHANLGEAGEARRRIAEARAAGTSQGEVAFRGAEVHARLGDNDGARDSMAQARALGIPETRFRSSPLLRALVEEQPVGTSPVEGQDATTQGG